MLKFVNQIGLNKYVKTMGSNIPEGEVIYCEETKKMYKYQNGVINELKIKGDSNVQMTLFEMNQQVVAQMDNHNDIALKNDMDLIQQYLKDTNNTFYMLLCKEISYYTIFQLDNTTTEFNFGEGVITVLTEDFGPIKSCELLEDNTIEIWTVVDDTVECFHLFPYDQGIIKARR